jgi:hypothetical protein
MSFAATRKNGLNCRKWKVRENKNKNNVIEKFVLDVLYVGHQVVNIHK